MTELYGELTHRLENDWTIKVNLQNRQRDLDTKYAYMSSTVNSDNTASFWQQLQRIESNGVAADLNISGPFELFGRTHELVLGANYQYSNTLNKFGGSGAANVDVFNIDLPDPSLTFRGGNRNRIEQYGAYGQARLQVFDPLTVVLGGRLTNFRNDTKNVYPTEGDWQELSSAEHEFTPFIGAIYDLSDQLSIYGSYSDIFVPQTDDTVTGAGLPPRVGKQYELGIKGEFFEDKLTASLSAFQLRDENRAVADPDQPGFSVAAGKVQSRGIEAEISGSPILGWNIYAGYSYLTTKYLSDPVNQGQRFSTDPAHTFKLWSNYEFSAGPLEGFRVGGGGRAYSEGTGPYGQDAYAVVDAQIGYRISDNLLATVSLNNIFDETYYARVPAPLFGQFGEPRNVMLTIRANW